MQNWLSFYGMIGGAAATLLGLLFVSVSVNASIILGPTHKHTRGLAEQAFQNYLAVLTLSLIEFVPGIEARAFGYVVLGTTGAWCILTVMRVIHTVRAISMNESQRAMFRRYAASIIGFGMLVYAGVQMSILGNDKREDVAIGLLLLIFSATIVSWELLISVAEEKKG